MADWKIEDRENDWLAQEMRREGYFQNKSGLEAQHAKEESSSDWDAGAISNAKEHNERHLRALRDSDPTDENKGVLGTGIWIAASFFAIGILNMLVSDLPYHVRYNPIVNILYFIINAILVISFILSIIATFIKAGKGGK